LISVEKGHVKISCEFSENLTQQHGFFHAGVATTIVDSACSYATLTMLAENFEVLTIEFKVNSLNLQRQIDSLQLGGFYNRAKF